MRVYDIVHAYQPFQDPDFNFSMEPWVEKNLKEVFVPTSKSILSGRVKRGVEIKGWTIDSWLNGNEEVVRLSKEFLSNIKQAVTLGYVELGFSGYSHPILPLLSEELIITQLTLGYKSAVDYLGSPTWFWPPEGAVSTKLLEILYKLYPEIIVVIPDVSLNKRNYSGLLKIHHGENEFQKALVCNTLLKDVVMNSICYKENPHSDIDMNWYHVQNMYFDKDKFENTLKMVGGDVHVLARDWENMTSARGLTKSHDGSADISGLIEMNVEFMNPSEGNWAGTEILHLGSVGSGSWEIEAHKDDPFLYWWPSEYGKHWETLTQDQKMWSKKWQGFINEFNDDYSQWCQKNGGLESILSDEKHMEEVKKLMPALLSCVPWHFLVKQVWEPSPGFSREAWDKLIEPARARLKKLLN